jgi:hypothetical protein
MQDGVVPDLQAIAECLRRRHVPISAESLLFSRHQVLKTRIYPNNSNESGVMVNVDEYMGLSALYTTRCVDDRGHNDAEGVDAGFGPGTRTRCDVMYKRGVG